MMSLSEKTKLYIAGGTILVLCILSFLLGRQRPSKSSDIILEKNSRIDSLIKESSRNNLTIDSITLILQEQRAGIDTIEIMSNQDISDNIKSLRNEMHKKDGTAIDGLFRVKYDSAVAARRRAYN